MTKKTEQSPAKRRTVIERTFKATIEEVWELWTTKDGIESWWGPDGFKVKVTAPGSSPQAEELRYQMIAVAPQMVEFMKKSGMPTVTDCRNTYTEVTPFSRLAFDCLVDFVPGVAPYEVARRGRASRERQRREDGSDPRRDARRGVDQESGHGLGGRAR